MSHNHRLEPRGAARPKRQVRIEAVQALESRQLLAPVVSTLVPIATFTPAVVPTNDNLGSVTVTLGGSVTASAAPLTSVAQLTSANSFGGDIVKIEAGPGGDFGKGVYAISRGAGENIDPLSRASGIAAPINRPGVIYRVDPATGKTSVFFDLNTVINQIVPGGNGGNGATPGSGLINWYDLAFDTEGVFDGKTSLFVSSLSQTDPNKNVIFRIGPDGSFLGLYIKFTAGATAQNFTRQPSAILVPPVEQQNFLKGLFIGQGNGNTAFNGTDAGNFQALFFDSNQFRPGQNLSGTALPIGVTTTPLNFGPQVGLTAANSSYNSPIYSAFTDFGTPGAGGVNAVPGLSGVQGLQGELIIGGGGGGNSGPIVRDFLAGGGKTPDTAGAIITPFRRFQDIAFDQFGYFSYGLGAAATRPTYQGSIFVSDLATGLSIQVTPVAPLPVTPINVPIQGTGGPISVQLGPDGTTVVPVFTNSSTTGGNVGGRIVRISPTGVITPFAEGFHTSGAQDANSFLGSELSITFSADGTTLYASDDDGIWQFKTVTDIANATSGSLIGLGDLRALGAPYDGQDSSVAIIDTGVDSLTPNFRGRVSTGLNVLNNSPGNDDTAAAGNGHGTLIAGVIAQFVPQATLNPVNVFTANQAVPGNTGTAATGNATTPQNIYTGLDFVAKNPFVKDPLRPNKVDRTIAANIGFGTTTTYQTETGPFKSFPQVTIAFKNQLSKFRALGIAPIAAAGQFGAPQGVTVGGTASGGDVTGISFPAVLNEVVSVTGSYPYPYTGNARTTPNDPGTGILPRPPGPLLLYGTGGTTIGNTISGGTAGVVAASDAIVFKDKLLASSNRSVTTDFTAPELDVPTWVRTVNGTIGGTVAGSVGGTGGNATFGFNTFQEGGTSLSSAIVTGSFAMVASALDYWTGIARNNGVTADGYLNTPIGSHVLNFGKGGIEDLSAYTNPDSINSILQWTAVPATDAPNTADTVNPPNLFRSPNFREFARIDVGNAIAAIEGSIALNYLFAHGSFDIIDADKNGLVTAQELQNFQDNSNNTGMAEAGAMARLLGGTARIPTTGFQTTTAGESPDQPDVLSRRFNFFEFIMDGQRNGAISIDQLRVLQRNLLPAPDAFTIIDRQRASSNGFLIDPKPLRNISDLQHLLPTYAFIPKSQLKKYKNVSPAKFGVGKGQLPSLQGPIFTLFSDGRPHTTVKAKKVVPAIPSVPITTTTTPKPTTSGTTTKPGSQVASPTNVNPVTTNPGTSYLDALTALAQGTSTTPKPNYTTILSTPRQTGTPAAATASGTGTISQPTSATPVTPTAKLASTNPATPIAPTLATGTPAATSSGATATTPVRPQTAAHTSPNSSKATKTQLLAATPTHVAPIVKPHATASGAAASKANPEKFNLWNPWKSIKKIFKK
ncbi:MAG: hypothetical protein JWN86_2380 [Planctomycetota bacterium]|nr:hypothetical protein [Planctomycetota bacterium]